MSFSSGFYKGKYFSKQKADEIIAGAKNYCIRLASKFQMISSFKK